MPIAILFMFVALALITPTLMHGVQQDNQLIMGTVAAKQLHQVTEAAKGYITAYAGAIEGSATATTPATITVPMLVNTGFLPQGFQSGNPYGQTWEVQVLQPQPGNLQALVLSQGGTPIQSADAPRIASEAGAEGGTIDTANNTAQGSYGGWSVSMSGYTNPGAGHLAALVAYSGGQLQSDYLYRVAVPGQPQLNTMQTNLDMGNNNINNAQDVNVNGDVDVNSTQETLGSGGTAQVTINSPNANVPAGIALNDSGDGGWGVRLQTNPADSNWLELTGNNGVVTSSWQGGNYSATGNVNAQNALTVNGGSAWWANNAGDSSQSGNAYVAGQVTANYDARLGTANGTANQNWGCSEYGEIAASANGNGQAMMCNGSSWQPIGGGPSQLGNFDNLSGYVNLPGIWQVCAASGGGSAAAIIFTTGGPYNGDYYSWGVYGNNLSYNVQCWNW